jgi:aldehyde dehydrogenase (NAD+)
MTCLETMHCWNKTKAREQRKKKLPARAKKTSNCFNKKKMSATNYTPLEEIKGIVDASRARFASGDTLSLAWRRAQLNKLRDMLNGGRQQFLDALHSDLRQTQLIADMEVDAPLAELENALANLEDWVRAEPVPVPLVMKPGSGEIVKEPFGVVAILAPFNFPLSLIFKPLIGALAAGNTAVVKPSEVSSECGRVTGELIREYFEPADVAVVTGAVAETTELLRQRFDFIMYTGNGMVGRIVMRAAAEHLTPVALELGGKSPAIVDASANLDVAARRLIFGKTMNSGQVCVAPDYVLVTRDVEQQLLARLRAQIAEFFGDDPKQTADFSRIVNERHTQRIKGLLDAGGFKVACGGQVDVAAHYVAPTVLTDVDPNAKIMQEEIFGPVLPVLPVDSVRDAIAFVNARPKPLALYVFSGSANTQRQIIAETHSGSVGVNDTVMQVLCPCLPFGGVGESGMGGYNGKHTFDLFSHRKSVLNRATWIDPSIRYPPMTPNKLKLVKMANGASLPRSSLLFALVCVPVALILFQMFIRPNL